MTTLPYWHVDAFANRPFAGNQAAVMPLASWLSDATLQAIAEENNFAETAFVVRDTSGGADWELRWFTPTSEVALCGHATLASGHVLIGERDAVRFATRKAGVLIVRREGDGYSLDLPVTRVAPAEDAALLAALGVEGTVFPSVSGAQQTSIILVNDAAAVRAQEVMAIVTAPGDVADVVSRVFVPAWGVDEDPVTGSAHAALAPFWAERLGRDRFTAFQASARGGHLTCTLEGNRAVLGGRCVTVMRGELLL